MQHLGWGCFYDNDAVTTSTFFKKPVPVWRNYMALEKLFASALQELVFVYVVGKCVRIPMHLSFSIPNMLDLKIF